MLTEKQITSALAQDDEIIRLYLDAFPEEERIPVGVLVRLVDAVPLDFTAYYDGSVFTGFTIVYPHVPFTWLWYVAVREELRGQGMGKAILSMLTQRYRGRSCIVDIESPEQACGNTEQRRRRHDFYLRNGFRDTDVSRAYAGIEYIIMIRGQDPFTMRDYDAVIRGLRPFWHPAETA